MSHYSPEQIAWLHSAPVGFVRMLCVDPKSAERLAPIVIRTERRK